MKPNPRTQIDDKGDEYSLLAATYADDKMITRQEYKDEADINLLLKRFGVIPGPQGTYGEVDYTLDLQTALAALASANKANFDVPTELRDKYRGWRDVLNATETGEYQRDLADLQREHDQKKAAATAPPVPPAAAPPAPPPA